MAHGEELEYLAKHPGGFDREALEVYVPRMIGEWTQHRGLTPETAIVSFFLRTGVIVGVSTARAALTWMAVFTEDGTMRAFPYSEVVAVDVHKRTRKDPRTRNPVGFRVDRVDESE